MLEVIAQPPDLRNRVEFVRGESHTGRRKAGKDRRVVRMPPERQRIARFQSGPLFSRESRSAPSGPRGCTLARRLDGCRRCGR